MFFEGIELLVTTEDFPDLSYLHAAALLFGFGEQPTPAAQEDVEDAAFDLAA